MMLKKRIRLIGVISFLMIAISCSSLLSKKNGRSDLVGKWLGKWDDISVELEFQPKNKGFVTYTNPLEKKYFNYKVKGDSITLNYPKLVRTYKFTVDQDKLYINSKDYKKESAEIIELIRYTRKKE